MKRREFLKTLGVTSAQLYLATAWGGSWKAFAREFKKRGRRVAVLGGGVGGMSAAHELAERGFEVSVYELKDIPGGKARSIGVPGSGIGGRKDLPGEHGFRFFPGFYKHLPDTMKRIPFAGNKRGVFDNLVPATRTQLSRQGKADIIAPARVPRDLGDLHAALKAAIAGASLIPPVELLFFVKKFHQFLTTCDERRMAEYEHISWWNFIEADRFSLEYQQFLAIGMTRNLVACRAEEVSTRTIGTIYVQLLLNVLGFGPHMDRVLNAPTNEAWIGPWLEHLVRMKVDYQLGARVEALHVDRNEMIGAVVDQGGVKKWVEADYFVCAVPAEVMARLVTSRMMTADPALGNIARLKVEWMNGIQFFLDRDVPIVHGHVNYYDSPWALTSISQKQFWPKVDLSKYGDGRVRGVFSVDISNWDEPGIVYGKPAQNCTAEEIRDEVIAQVCAHLNDGIKVFDEAWVLSWFLDPSVIFPTPGQAESLEPLLINTLGSVHDRPFAASKIPNLFLAADYVRCATDLACMEAANEAARFSVNGIIELSGSKSDYCETFPLKEPAIFYAGRRLDRWRFKRGLPHRTQDLSDPHQLGLAPAGS